MKKVLITGFEPFGGEKINPTVEIINQLPKKILDYEVVTKILPTVFEKSKKELEQVIDFHEPEILISLGQAGGRSSVTVEKVAINLNDARIQDNEGQKPHDTPVVVEGPDAFFSTLPVKSIVKAIQEKGIPASVSYSAGTYVCNHVMYAGLYKSQSSMFLKKAGFIHIPYVLEQCVDKSNMPSMSYDTLVLAIITSIEQSIIMEKDLTFASGTEC